MNGVLNAENTLIGMLGNLFTLPYPEKKVSVMRQVIHVCTDQKSIAASEQALQHLIQVQDLLPLTEEQYKAEDVKKMLDITGNNLNSINAFLDNIDKLFDHSETEVVIDDEGMIKVISNMNKAKDVLEYVYAYLDTVVEIQKNKKAEKHIVSLEDLILCCNAA